jgi:outer membrane protein TolC
MTNRWLSFLPLCLFIFSVEAMTLEEYLSEVKMKNGALVGLKVSTDAKGLRLEEGNLFFTPTFFFTGEYYDDQRPTNAPVFQGRQTLRHTLRSGLSQNFSTGTRATLSYNYYKTQLNGVSRSLIPRNKFFDVAPQIEITQSLWRNFLGSEFEAQVNVQKAQVETQKFNELFTSKQLLMNAENAYWRLYVAQNSLKVQLESLERAKKLRDWNEQRFKNNLTDESDLIQAEANLQSREIDYQDTLTEIKTALQEFNSFREEKDDFVNLLETKSNKSFHILNASVPPRMKMREDVRALLAGRKLAQANAHLGAQRNRPSFELYGSYSINGRDPNSYNDSMDMAFTATRPFSVLGLRFSTPLDVGALSDYKKAYSQEASAADMQFRRKAYEVDREYEILEQRFENFKKRLRLIQKMVEVQERKLNTEKRRYNQGRTTTFQVLQFEQDYANTQLLKLRYKRELIAVFNQLKLFSGVDYEQY